MFINNDIPVSKRKVGFYELHGKQNDRHIIWGPVGIWSTPYYVKPSKHVF